jgi:GDPmannose 4,6-dehydratase
LVTGASGQDGSYLIELLTAQGYRVHAQSRRPQPAERDDVVWHAGDLTDARFLAALIETAAPDEIYNLAAVSRPALSWEIPDETLQLNAAVPQRICELLVKIRPSCRLFQASTSEMFGPAADPVQTERSSLQPNSPYGASKAFAHQIVGAYRNRYGLHACCGILFNHESPRRPLGFVSQKIAHAAAAISLGQRETRELDERGLPIVRDGKLHLGNINVYRDFGFAGDVAQAMQLIIRHDKADDYIIGTGRSHSIAEFCEAAFAVAGLDWRDYVEVDTALMRAGDMPATRADSSKLRALGWQPEIEFGALVAMMVNARIGTLKQQQ